MLKTYTYTCSHCNHVWTDARPPAYASAPTEYPCACCQQKGNITFAEKPAEIVEVTSGGPALIDPTRLGGRVKPPAGFKEVLTKVAQKYPGHNIKLD